MTDKSWQSSHKPPCRGEKTGTCHTDKPMEREKGGKSYENSPLAQENINANDAV